jgi:hypothetical protein
VQVFPLKGDRISAQGFNPGLGNSRRGAPKGHQIPRPSLIEAKPKGQVKFDSYVFWDVQRRITRERVPTAFVADRHVKQPTGPPAKHMLFRGGQAPNSAAGTSRSHSSIAAGGPYDYLAWLLVETSVGD